MKVKNIRRLQNRIMKTHSIYKRYPQSLNIIDKLLLLLGINTLNYEGSMFLYYFHKKYIDTYLIDNNKKTYIVYLNKDKRIL